MCVCVPPTTTIFQLVELSKAQDIEAGDGTTSVVVLAGSLLDVCSKLLRQGIHPTKISEAFGLCAEKAVEILREMAIPLDLSDRSALINAAVTCLSSKVVYQQADLLADIAVESVLRCADLESSTVDLKKIRGCTHLPFLSLCVCVCVCWVGGGLWWLVPRCARAPPAGPHNIFFSGPEGTF